MEKKHIPAVLRDGKLQIRCRYPRAFPEALENAINKDCKPPARSIEEPQAGDKPVDYLITGTVNDTGFELNRVVVRNEKRFTLQTVRGKIEPRRDGGCTISVKFEPTPFAHRMFMLCDLPLYLMCLDGFFHYLFKIPSLFAEHYFMLFLAAGAMWIVAESVQYFMRSRFPPDRGLVEHIEQIARQVDAT